MSAWQPIESAPKAGKIILVYAPEHGRCVAQNDFGLTCDWGVEAPDAWFVVVERDPDHRGPLAVSDGSHFNDLIQLHPTLWMELPELPA